MNRRTIDLISLIITIVILIAYTTLLIPRQVYHRLSFLFSNPYYYLIYLSLIIAFIMIFLRLLHKTGIKDRTLKIIYGILFLPVLYFPIIRCYFKVPYVFCKACPRRCPFGELRPFIIPSFLLLNLDKRFWCFKLCPLGTIQDYQCKATKKRIHVPRWLINVRYIFLALTILSALGLIFTQDYFYFFFRGTHHLYAWGLTISSVIFILSFFIPRFWCKYFCPVGSFGDIALKIGNRMNR